MGPILMDPEKVSDKSLIFSGQNSILGRRSIPQKRGHLMGTLTELKARLSKTLPEYRSENFIYRVFAILK